MVSRQEVLNSELSFIKSENEYIAAQNIVKISKMAFNTKLGYEVMSELSLKSQLSYKEFKLDSIADAVSAALDKRYEVKALEFAYESEEINTEIAKKTYPDFSYPYKQQMLKLEEAQKSLQNLMSNIEMEVRSNYLEITQKYNEIKSGEKSVELAEEALKLSKLTYENGMGMQTDVQKAQVALQQAKLGLSKAILDYNLAVLKFEDSIAVGRK